MPQSEDVHVEVRVYGGIYEELAPSAELTVPAGTMPEGAVAFAGKDSVGLVLVSYYTGYRKSECTRWCWPTSRTTPSRVRA